MLVLTGIAMYIAKDVGINHDYERFFPKNDPDLKKYEDYSKTFNEEDGNFFMVGIEGFWGVFIYAILLPIF